MASVAVTVILNRTSQQNPLTLFLAVLRIDLGIVPSLFLSSTPFAEVMDEPLHRI